MVVVGAGGFRQLSLEAAAWDVLRYGAAAGLETEQSGLTVL